MQEPERIYPKRLFHNVPGWVRDGACFHIRLRVASEHRVSLTEPDVAGGLIGAARYYHEHQRWCCRLFLVMPDHLHAMISFPSAARMSRVIGEWKSYTARKLGVLWQDNYFDHRLRHDGEASETYEYILQNPVVKGLCLADQTWPWQWSGGERP